MSKSDSFNTSGRLHVIRDTKQMSERFSKREFIVEIGGDTKYPQFVAFELTGDRCNALDGATIGDEIKVEFNLRGREWTSKSGEVKYFNSLDAWKVDVASKAKPSGVGGAAPTDDFGGAPIGEDEIPFASADMAHEPSAIARVLR